MENMLSCTPSIGAAEYMWSVRDLDLWEHDKFLNKGHKVWPNSIQT
jgi:hypothetical protein